MTLLESIAEDNTSIIAMNKFIQERALVKGLCLGGNHSKNCEAAGVNRPHMYERFDQLIATMGKIELPGPGRPVSQSVSDSSVQESMGWQFRQQVFRYRMAHPSALVEHVSGYSTYSDSFVRFILDLYDTCVGSIEWFCTQAEVPCQTVRCWIKRDQSQPYQEHQPRQHSPLSGRESDDVIEIIKDYAMWEGSLRDFLKCEAERLRLRKSPIYKVLKIFGLLPVRSRKKPRYRGSTEKCDPGDILVTDGKMATVVNTNTGEIREFNWQGIIDQATTCHTAVVVTDTESAQAVREAFDASCKFIGHPPQALIHDNKPIHDEAELQKHIGKTTIMIPATPNRGENKAGIEGEFGKFEQTVGPIYINDSSPEQLMKSVLSEVLRGYTKGINHAGRVEFNGESREGVLRKTCPDPDKNRKFIEELHGDHTKKQRFDPLRTKAPSRAILDEAFERFGIADLDTKGYTRDWIAGKYTPEAIRQGLSIFGTEREKGRLRNKTAHRYLVALIMSCQDDLDLRRQEELLREFAEVERKAWLHAHEAEYAQLIAECVDTTPDKDLVFRLAENAAFGCMNLQRAFYEDKLKGQLNKEPDRYKSVCRHIRRLFETTWENRFLLISKLVNWEYQLTA